MESDNKDKMKVFICHKVRFALLFLLLAGCYEAVLALEAATVSGYIVTIEGKPAADVMVGLQKGGVGAVTNPQGYYSFTAVAGKDTLVASSIEYVLQKKEIVLKAGRQVTVNFTLTENNNRIEEVEVRGKSKIRQVREQALHVAAVDMHAVYNTSEDMHRYLNKTAGIRVRESGGAGSDYTFSLNGFSGRQVKFFLDGIPMDNFGSSWGLHTIPSSAIERIEVYKGVLPVHLGADALGGALNIISRRDANYLDASYSFGSFNTHKAALNGTYTNPKNGMTVRINTYYNYSDNNYRVYVPILNLETKRKEGYQTVKRFHDGYQAKGVKVEAGVTDRSFADFLLLGLIASGDEKDIQTGMTMESVFGAKTSNSRSLIPSIRYKKSNLGLQGLHLIAFGGYNDTQDNHIDTTARRYNWLGEWAPSTQQAETARSRLLLRYGEWLAHINLTYALHPHHNLSLNYAFSAMRRKVFDHEEPDNAANKLQQRLEKHLAGLGWNVQYVRWNASALVKMYNMAGHSYRYADLFTDTERLESLRMDYAYWGYAATFSAFILPPLQAKLSYEHTYRLPEAQEIFGDGLFTVRNANLKPESSHNVNIGLVYEADYAQNHLLLESHLLYRDAKDYIQKELQAPSTQFINLGSVKTVGVESGVKYDWRKRIQAGASLTWQQAKDNMEYVITEGYVGAGKYPNFTYKDQLPNMPYLFGNADLGVTFPNLLRKNAALTLEYSFLYVHAYYLSWAGLGAKDTKSIIPQQAAHHLSAGYSLQDGKYNVTLACNNLTDARLYDNYMLQKPGRAFYIKLRYSGFLSK